LLREALEPLPVPVLGVLRHDDRLVWRDRHLGLVPVAEHPADVSRALGHLADAITVGVDLPAAVALARSAPDRSVGPVALPLSPAPGRGRRRAATESSPRIAVASGAAFTFTYTDTVEALEAAGAEVVPFDPLRAGALPDAVDGLLAGGGFPEVHAGELAANHDLLADVHRRVTTGLPTWAECGGLLWLGRSLDGHRMVGALDAEAHMSTRLTLGYRHAVTCVTTPLGPSGRELRGHEFHYSTVDAPGEALELSSRWGSRREGHATATLLATYLHHHPGGDPSAVAAFVDTCTTRARARARLR
jgi:cobyrinic acid a,c-diamide synthase